MSSPANPPEITQERVRHAIEGYRNRDRAIEYPECVRFITTTLKDTFGVEISTREVIEFWEWYSETYWFAGWLKPNRDDVVRGFPAWIRFLEGGEYEDLP